MKLYLSSYRIPTPQDLMELVGKKPQETIVAIIPNAKDYLADRAWNVKTNQCLDFFKGQGYNNLNVIDLRQYDENRLESDLGKYDLVWANGGNTFCLRYEMRRSGFERIIEKLVKSGIIYGGESAGALVAGSTIKGSEDADEPEFAQEIIWEGLELTHKILIPHADNESLKSDMEPMIEMYRDNPDAVILNDNQAYIVDGDQSRIVTGA